MKNHTDYNYNLSKVIEYDFRLRVAKEVPYNGEKFLDLIFPKYIEGRLVAPSSDDEQLVLFKKRQLETSVNKLSQLTLDGVIAPSWIWFFNKNDIPKEERGRLVQVTELAIDVEKLNRKYGTHALTITPSPLLTDREQTVFDGVTEILGRLAD